MKSKKRDDKQKASGKLSSSSLPFSAKEFAEWIELYDIGQDYDAFPSFSGKEREKTRDIALKLLNDLDDAFEKAENAKVKTFYELMVHLDLNLSGWHLPSNFITDVIKSLDNPVLLSSLLLSSMTMVESLISCGLLDSQITNRGLYHFLRYVAKNLHDIDEINDSAAVVRVVSAWNEREKLVREF